MRIVFSPDAREDQRYFREHEPKTADKIKSLLKNIMQTPFSGMGKPEPLKHDLAGFCSRRITHEHRLVYMVEGDTIHVASCHHHRRNGDT